MIRVIIKRGPFTVVDEVMETVEEANVLKKTHNKPPVPVGPGAELGPEHYSPEISTFYNIERYDADKKGE